AGSFEKAGLIQQAYYLNFSSAQCPSAQCPAWSAFSVSSPAIMLETVKQAGAGVEEGRAKGLRCCLALHEACGSTVTTWLQTSLLFKEAMLCDFLEHPNVQDHLPLKQQGLRLSFSPFCVLFILLVPRC
ncbi:MA2C1 mannosidase, partial [Thryothorus ludovicianus]|nr:MA2C1 mannosidase [Thryothorus ludovicianus]